MRSIRILGIGGQGIAFSGWLLGYAATLSGLYASVHHSYGAEVRGGTVISNIIIDEEPIENPYREDFDTYIVLHSFGWKNVELRGDPTIIADIDIAEEEAPMNKLIDWKPFDKIAHEEELPINILALGYLCRKGIVSYEALKTAIETRGKGVERNLKALDRGYNL